LLNDSSLENRFELNVALLNSLAKRGFPPKQIFVLGHSCGAWNALRLSALHPELLNSGIAMMPNCWDKSRDSLIRKKLVGQMRSFSKSNALVRHSPVDGSVDYEGSSIYLRWIDDIEGVEWIELPKSISNCRFLHEGEIGQHIKRGHDMPFSNCWFDYHPAILKYIEKRVAAEL